MMGRRLHPAIAGCDLGARRCPNCPGESGMSLRGTRRRIRFRASRFPQADERECCLVTRAAQEDGESLGDQRRHSRTHRHEPNAALTPSSIAHEQFVGLGRPRDSCRERPCSARESPHPLLAPGRSRDRRPCRPSRVLESETRSWRSLPGLSCAQQLPRQAQYPATRAQRLPTHAHPQSCSSHRRMRRKSRRMTKTHFF